MNDSIRSERPSMLSQGEIFTSKCITNMNTSSPLKRILNNLTIQVIFKYFMDIYNKLFPYSNILVADMKSELQSIHNHLSTIPFEAVRKEQ